MAAREIVEDSDGRDGRPLCAHLWPPILCSVYLPETHLILWLAHNGHTQWICRQWPANVWVVQTRETCRDDHRLRCVLCTLQAPLTVGKQLPIDQWFTLIGIQYLWQCNKNNQPIGRRSKMESQIRAHFTESFQAHDRKCKILPAPLYTILALLIGQTIVFALQ